jgi:hypothetical protein
MPPFDFDAAVTAPFRMKPGLRKLAVGARTLHALAPGSPAFAEKLAVLRQTPGAALLCVDGFDPLPAWRALADAAQPQCPEALARDEDGLAAPRLGAWVSWDGRRVTRLPQAHEAALACLEALPAPQRIAGLLSLALHEDVAVVDGCSTVLQALAVCLPSHWTPAEKIGRPFAAVHAPVADNATLLAAARHLMQLVCQPQRWERFVWNVTAHPHHDQHPHRHGRRDWPADAAALVAAAHWRTEQQSFIPLPERQQAVFTIHVDVQPLAAAIDTTARAAALHAALATMSEAVLGYRGLAAARPALLAWLAARQ